MTNDAQQGTTSKPGLIRSIGPAIIVASVVLGPGSILTSSRVGHEYGYRMAWVLILAGILMIGMVALAGRLGVLLKGTICDELAARLGRPFAALIGIVMFLVVASFQSSNNIAVVTAIEPLIGSSGAAGDNRVVPVAILLLLNGVIIAALYGFKQLYAPVERFMKLLVLVMIVGFMGNVIFAQPSIVELGKGLVPAMPRSQNFMPLLGLIATTFSIGGAFYQGYLVREKGWTLENAKQGVMDSAIGISILCGTTLIIMLTAAAVLHGRDVKLESAADVAVQLKPLFGPAAMYLFSMGLLAGAISSFMVNAMIGGAILSDGLGLGWSMNQKWPKAFTVVALLIGMGVAIAATAYDVSRVGLIVFAQALTVIGGPLLAFALVFLGFGPELKGERAVPGWIKFLACLGMVVTLVLAGKTASDLYGKFAPPAAKPPAVEGPAETGEPATPAK